MIEIKDITFEKKGFNEMKIQVEMKLVGRKSLDQARMLIKQLVLANREGGCGEDIISSYILQNNAFVTLVIERDFAGFETISTICPITNEPENIRYKYVDVDLSAFD